VQSLNKMNLKVGLVQMDCALGNLRKNIETVKEYIQSQKGKADILIFPELTLTGYGVGNEFHRYSLRTNDDLFLDLISATEDITIAVGFIEETESFSFYNSLATIKDKEILNIHRKVYLPNYGMFEERKHFKPGADYSTFVVDKFRFAPFICGDAWSPAFVHLAASDLANVIFISVCSPDKGLGSRLSSRENWKRLIRFYASMYGCYVVFVNRVGSESNLKFWGESEVIDPFGNRLGGFDDDSEGVVVCELFLTEVREARTVINTIRDEDFNFLARRLRRVMELSYEWHK